MWLILVSRSQVLKFMEDCKHATGHGLVIIYKNKKKKLWIHFYRHLSVFVIETGDTEVFLLGVVVDVHLSSMCNFHNAIYSNFACFLFVFACARGCVYVCTRERAHLCVLFAVVVQLFSWFHFCLP